MVKYSSEAKNEMLDATFGALSDPTRRAILIRLSKGGAQVTELAEPFGISLPAISKHLRVLEKAKLINRTIEGRVHRLHMNPDTLKTAHGWIEQYEKFWTEQFDSLETYLGNVKLEKTQKKEKPNESSSGSSKRNT